MRCEHCKDTTCSERKTAGECTLYGVSNIEIPFGAFDSELGSCEHTIPKGYEAEIKDGKVIIRKSDCEDKKIRKSLINYFRCVAKNGDTVWTNLDYDKVIAWLEKQGEHYNFRQNVQIGDKVTRNKDGVLVNLSQLERVVKKDEKQCEQKPIEDELFDNRVQYASIEEGIKAHAETYSFNIDSLLYNQLNKDQQELWRKEIEQAVISGGEAGVELANDRRYQKKPVEEVNGEDYGIYSLWHAVRILEDTLGKVDGYQSDDGILEHKAAITAVKNLKEQKPVEWSEDDEAARKDIIDKLERIKMAHVGSECEICQMEIGWLKSLHPQKQWKPSEEQLDALYDVLNPSDGVDKKALESLYEQLKAIGCE